MSKGVDIRIESLRTKFVSDLWTANDVSFYGRIFRIERDGIRPMRFIYPDDYADVLTTDMKDGICFFDVLPAESYQGYFLSTVWVQFAVNLSKLYPAITERATEYAHADAKKIIEQKWGQGAIAGLTRGIEAFAEYGGVKVSDNMQPYYIFRFETQIKYPLNC